MKGFILLLLAFGSAIGEETKAPPRISIWNRVQPIHEIYKNTVLNITCQLDKYSGEIYIRWKFNGKTITFIPIENSTTISILNITVNGDFIGEYECESQGAWAKTELKEYPEIPGSAVMVTKNSILELNCPHAEVQAWYKEGIKLNEEMTDKDKNIKYNMTQSSLLISSLSYGDVGAYECAAVNEINETVYVYARPHVKKFDKSRNAVQGENVEIKCEVRAYPEAEVIWSFIPDDSEVVSILKSNDLRINMTDYNGAKNAYLTIRTCEFEDRGEYICEAVNQFGSDKEKVRLRVKDKLAALWPFLGIIAEVIILCVIIFIYERRRAKKKEAEEEKEEAGHLTNSHGTKESDVRHRSK